MQDLVRHVAEELAIDARTINHLRILRRSIDARQRNIFVNLSVRVFVGEEPDDVFEKVEYCDVDGAPHAIVVGEGPAGLFAALKLIELGVKPIVLERGKNVNDRKRDLAAITRQQTINPESNYSENHESQKADKPKFMKGLVERDIHLSTFIVPVGIDWGGKTLAELAFGKRYGVQVAGIQRGQQRINIPSASTLILPGDRLQVIGSDKQLADFGQALEAMNAEVTLQDNPKEMTLRRLVLVSNSPFVGKTIKDCGIRDQYQCLVVGVESEEGEGLLTPHPMQQLNDGDIIWVVGEETNIKELEGSNHIKD